MKVSLIAVTLGFFLTVGMPFTALGGSLPTGNDGDSDTIDDNVDNCLNDANADQLDDNHDGCGNVCDASALTADFSGDGVVGAADFATLSGNWNTTPGPGSQSSGDASGDGVVGAADFAALSSQWNESTGPSAVVVRASNCKP